MLGEHGDSFTVVLNIVRGCSNSAMYSVSVKHVGGFKYLSMQPRFVPYGTWVVLYAPADKQKLAATAGVPNALGGYYSGDEKRCLQNFTRVRYYIQVIRSKILLTVVLLWSDYKSDTSLAIGLARYCVVHKFQCHLHLMATQVSA